MMVSVWNQFLDGYSVPGRKFCNKGMCRLNRYGALLVILLVTSAMLTGCSTLKQPTIGVNLPEKYNTPDGMVLDADNNIFLCCPNFNDDKYPAKLLKVAPDDKISEVFTFPVHPETRKACPLGIDLGPDGNFYVADNQAVVGAVNKARLLRIVIKQGKAVGCEVLVTGLNQSNGVSCYGDSVYVTETSLDSEAALMPSGVYRFRYSEFRGEPIKLLPGGKDKHLIATIYTDNPDWPVGANGLTFDSEGNMYVANFGEAGIVKFTFDKSGKVASQEVLVQGRGIESADGMKFDPKTNAIYVADFVGNAIHKVDVKTGKVTTIAKNANNSGGVGGLLDRPSEVCFRDNKIYVSNIDLPGNGNVYDKPHTLSVIELDN
jgi:sugar lactone lactonase YvrE